MANFDDIKIENPVTGIILYKNIIKKDLNIINRLEKVIQRNSDDFFRWKPSLVGDKQSNLDHRNCHDFKINKKQLSENKKAWMSDLRNIYYDIEERLAFCVNDYAGKYAVSVEYTEAFNFVKYGEGEYFHVHPDHGPTYVCVLSSVMYLNDNYEGGGLYFPHFDYSYRPEEGDLLLFPSSFIYQHAALPVTSGIKYSVVTMFDYNDRFHNLKPMQDIS
jgi:hypothetical protein